MRGIVVHTTKIGDQKKVVEVFTDKVGCVSFIVRIATGKSGGRNNIFYQPLSIIEFVSDIKPRETLHYMKDVRMPAPFLSIPFDVYKASIVMFLSEFLHFALRGEYEDKPLFEFLTTSIEWLDEMKTSVANFHLAFLMQISRFLGLYPNLSGYRSGYIFDLVNGCFSAQTPMHTYCLKTDEARWIYYLMQMRYTNMYHYKLSREQRMRCLTILNEYYRLHIPNFPELKSLDILKDLFD